MENDTPEYFYKKIQEITTKINEDNTNNITSNYKTYYDDLAKLRTDIQSQIDLIVSEKPVKSQQMLKDYKDIYDANYMTNFCFFLGICLIFLYIFKSNSKSSQNVAQSPPPL
jgi:hypothetical protein